jgi:hypothetical protein
VLLRNILRRALRKAGLPPLRFHDLRHLAGTLMSEAGLPPKRAQEILGHADVRTTLAIYTHTMKRKHDDSADRMAELAGLSSVGYQMDINDASEPEEGDLSACFDGSPGRIIRAARSPFGSPWRALAAAARRRRTVLFFCRRFELALTRRGTRSASIGIFWENGSPGRIRTADQRINSPSLYH